MWTLRFWQDWPRDNRIFLYVFFIVFASTLAGMWTAYFIEPAPAIELETIQEPDLVEIQVDRFSKGPFDFIVKGNNYVILQRQLGSILTTSTTVAYTYLFTLAVFVVGMLAVISTLGRFYYLFCMGVFILFVTTLSFEVLGVMGLYGKSFTLVVMAFYCLPSFWLFYFGTTVSFPKRILVFTIVTIVVWAFVNYLSTTEMPFLHLATYSAEAGMIACCVFIATVAHEILAGFVFAVTQNTRTGKSLNHFLIISVIYFINLVLAYSTRFRFITWDLITINLFLLLTISGVLGIWGIRQRRKAYEGIVDSDPYAVYAFLLMGAFTFATIAMLLLNANDTALSAISDIIIFSHLGFGFIFILYVISNFAGMLAQNFNVHKVLYSPTNMPFFTMRFAGLVATLAVLFYNTWQVPFYNAKAGYYSGVADMYAKTENDRLAEAYYDESRGYSFSGHHANYALANIAGASLDNAGERNFYDDASAVRPTPMSYLNWAQTYQATNDFVGAISTLSEGVKRMDNNSSIANTLGLVYAKAGLPDSAELYLRKAMTSSSLRDVASANILGLTALGLMPVDPEGAPATGNDPVSRTNRLALYNSLGRDNDESLQLPTDTVLTLPQAAAISNYLVNTKSKKDTTYIRKVIALARKSSNSGFKESLLFASAISLYNAGETKEAFLMLEEVTVGSDRQGRYNNILTMWAIENDEPQRALGYAEYALSQSYGPAKLTYAVALTEDLRGRNDQLRNTLAAWDSVRNGSDSSTINLANMMRNVLGSPENISNSTDELYAYTRYRLTYRDSATFFLLASGPGNDDLKAKAMIDFAEKLYAADRPSAALRMLTRIAGLELTDPSIGQRMRILEMMSRVNLGQTSLVLEAIKTDTIKFTGKEKKYQVYFDALAARAAGDTTNASKYFHWLGTANPYFEDGVIAAAEYFQKKGQTSYDMLTQALLYHPSSMRIKKAYALESARQGLADYARVALDELKPLISAQEYNELTRKADALLAVER